MIYSILSPIPPTIILCIEKDPIFFGTKVYKSKKMVLQISSLVLFIIIFISSPSSLSSLEEAPLHESTHDQLANGYINSTIRHPNSIGTINNGQRYGNFAPLDRNVMIKYEGGNFDFEKSGQKGVRKTSHLVNVDHFGAKGGTDNSEVLFI